MSRPAAAARRASGPATQAGAHTRRPLRAVPTRRVSGPTRPTVRPAPRRPAVATAPGGLLLGAAGIARALPDSRAIDRLIRGRAWVAVIAVALIGIVAMQVHMLGLNAGIGRAVEKATTLEQQNTALRLDVSRLSSGERIAAEAQRLGLVMPNAGEVRYTDLHATDAAQAAKTMRAPDPDLAAQAKAAVEAGVGTGASALAPQSAEKAPGDAPAPTATAGTQPQTQTAPDPAATQTQTQQPQAQTQTPAPATQAQTPAPAATQPQPQPQPQQQQPQGQPQAPVEQQGTTAPAAVTPAGGAAATPGN